MNYTFDGKIERRNRWEWSTIFKWKEIGRNKPAYQLKEIHWSYNVYKSQGKQSTWSWKTKNHGIVKIHVWLISKFHFIFNSVNLDWMYSKEYVWI